MTPFPILGPVSNAWGHLVKFQHRKEGGKFQAASAFLGTLIEWSREHTPGPGGAWRWGWSGGDPYLRNHHHHYQRELGIPQWILKQISEAASRGITDTGFLRLHITFGVPRGLQTTATTTTKFPLQPPIPSPREAVAAGCLTCHTVFLKRHFLLGKGVLAATSLEVNRNSQGSGRGSYGHSPP